MRILLPEVPGLFSLSSSGVHDVMVLLQHLSAINVFIAEATEGGDRFESSWPLNKLFPYDDGTSLSNESSVEFSTMEYNN